MSASLTAAKEFNKNAAVAAVFSELDGLFALKEQLKAFLLE